MERKGGRRWEGEQEGGRREDRERRENGGKGEDTRDDIRNNNCGITAHRKISFL
jgi:hypothetical protein